MSPQSTESRAVVAWMQVLDRIEQTLGESLAVDQEAAIPAFPPVPESGSLWQQLDDRLARLQNSLDQAGSNAAAIDAYLQAEAVEMQRYLDKVRASERKLAEWVSRAV
jgi:hypothetical protein